MSSFVDNFFSIKDKVILVTGASKGIGMVLADKMAQAGGNVFALARSVSSKVDIPCGVTYKQCDVTDDEAFSAICRDISSSEYAIDVLVNAAGISLFGDGCIDIERFSRTIEVNLKAAYTCSMIVSSYMRKSKSPSIVNITSINSIVGFPGNPGYVASKGGLRMLTKALAIDLIKDNIRVNAIAPGYIHTDMTDKSFSDPELYEQRLKHMIIPRWGKPEDIVGAAIFLISEASSYMTGQDIIVDGGWTAKGLII